LARYLVGGHAVSEKSSRVQIKRVYEPASPADGARVLVDRIWPRGLSKEHADVKLWLKDIAPSTDLRKWFGHDPERWSEFRTRYWAELAKGDEAVTQLVDLIKHGHTTLAYAAHDELHNNAVALLEYLVSHRHLKIQPATS
jgi:uncharacterized protein YeaO (DUF488 family)